MSRILVPPDSGQIRVLNHPCHCSSRQWSLFITFYAIKLILAATGLPFILCRTVDISARLEHQLETYTETTIWDNLPESDIAAADAQLDAFTVSLPLFLSVSLENIISSGADYDRLLDFSCVHGSIFVTNYRKI